MIDADATVPELLGIAEDTFDGKADTLLAHTVPEDLSKALRSSVQSADREGVPVVAHDRLAEGPVSGHVSFAG
jgi:hypothetical protein